MVSKTIWRLLLLAAVFTTGYYLGSRSVKEIESDITAVRQEMARKTTEFDKEVRGLRLRLQLVNIRDRLIQARSDVLEKNFGQAMKGVTQSLEKVTIVRELAGENQKKRLEELESQIQQAKVEIERLSPGAQQRLVLAQNELDRLLEQ